MINLSEPIEFDWNKGNKDKNWKKHRVKNKECEEIFYDEDKRIINDVLHTGKEKRYILLGKTKKDRLLFTVFTMRKKKVRIISSRDINSRERRLYEKAT